MTNLLSLVLILSAILFIIWLFKELDGSNHTHRKNKKYDFLIYKATNRQNGKVYIGSTKYRDITREKNGTIKVRSTTKNNHHFIVRCVNIEQTHFNGILLNECIVQKHKQKTQNTTI